PFGMGTGIWDVGAAVRTNDKLVLVAVLVSWTRYTAVEPLSAMEKPFNRRLPCVAVEICVGVVTKFVRNTSYEPLSAESTRNAARNGSTPTNTAALPSECRPVGSVTL